MCDFFIKIREIEKETCFADIKCYLFAFKPKPNKKVKITTKSIISQMITQDSWIYKFIQYKFIKMCDFCNKIREIERETCFADVKCYFFCLGTNKKLYIPQIMKL